MVRRLAGSSVVDRDGVLVVSTPSNPGFHWGNYLVMPVALGEGGGREWDRRFVSEFPGLAHRAYAVESDTDSDAHELGASGLLVDRSTVLTRSASEPFRTRDAPAGVDLRRLDGAEDWADLAGLRLARVETPETPGHRAFRLRKVGESRTTVENGHGAWFGVYESGVLVSALGVVTDGLGLVRYQDVETHPRHRRRGLASSLVEAAGRYVRDAGLGETLVIVADPEGPAVGLYRSAGFLETETQTKLYRAADEPG